MAMIKLSFRASMLVLPIDVAIKLVEAIANETAHVVDYDYKDGVQQYFYLGDAEMRIWSDSDHAQAIMKTKAKRENRHE